MKEKYNISSPILYWLNKRHLYKHGSRACRYDEKTKTRPTLYGKPTKQGAKSTIWTVSMAKYRQEDTLQVKRHLWTSSSQPAAAKSERVDQLAYSLCPRRQGPSALGVALVAKRQTRRHLH